VVITDAHPTTVNSIYSNIGYNSAAKITISAGTNPIDSGQTEIFTLNRYRRNRSKVQCRII
jgi:hypothetical protein